MNILFYTHFEVVPEKGGTERITSSVAEALNQEYGWKCYSVYSAPFKQAFRSVQFESRFCIGSMKWKKNREALRRFIEENDIDIIVNQGYFDLCSVFASVTAGIPKIRQVFAHHFAPGWEQQIRLGKNFWFFPKSAIDVLRLAWHIVKYPYIKLTKARHKKALYRSTYRLADKVVLLSCGFIPQFMRYAGLHGNSKFAVIHNMLSFDSFFDMADYGLKQKEVLIVSRFDDWQKRLSLALRLWAAIEQDSDYNEWTLRLVGHGDDEPALRALAGQLGLQRVVFEGARPSKTYYERASIFMMTSRSEGWGLTLTEAQQMGCVPLAFDTYASLHDIITDGENGFILQDGDMNGYVGRIKQLMSDDGLRKSMAKNAIESSYRFSQETIGTQWHDLLCNVAGHEIANNSPNS